MVSVLHHRVPADLPETFPALGPDDLTWKPTELCDHRKMQLLFEFCGGLCRPDDCHIVPIGELQNAHFGWSLCPLLRSYLRGVGAA